MIVPKFCVGCGKIGRTFVCQNCRKLISEISFCFCLYCQKPTSYNICRSCRKNSRIFLDRLESVTSYSHPLAREAVKALKYGGETELAEWLGRLMTMKLRHLAGSGKVLLIPVPLHFWKQRRRGFNQAELLALAVSKVLHIPAYKSIIRRRSLKTPQSRLTLAERMALGKEEFLLAGSRDELDYLFRNKTVLIIDDVVTSGQTLNACAELIKEAFKPRLVWGLTFARS